MRKMLTRRPILFILLFVFASFMQGAEIGNCIAIVVYQ